MLDVQNVQRGACKEQDCDCNDYTIIESVKNFLCMYCGHYPSRHLALQQVSLTSTSLPDTKDTTTATATNSTSTNTENVLYVKSEDLDEPELSNDAQSESPVHDSQEEKTEVVADVGLSGVNERSYERSYERYHSPCDDYANYNDTPEPYQQIYAEKSHTSFNLPPFSEYVQPYLNGTATDRQISGMRNQLISELIDYLDAEKLLTSNSSSIQSWGSRWLQRAILFRYPNIVKEQSKRKCPPKGALSVLISRVLGNRRKRNNNAKKMAHSTFRNSDSTFRNSDSTFRNSDSTFRNSDSTFRNSDSTFGYSDSTIANSDSTCDNDNGVKSHSDAEPPLLGATKRKKLKTKSPRFVDTDDQSSEEEEINVLC